MYGVKDFVCLSVTNLDLNYCILSFFRLSFWSLKKRDIRFFQFLIILYPAVVAWR